MTTEIPDPWLDIVPSTSAFIRDDGSEKYLVRLAERELTASGIPFSLEYVCGQSSIRADLITENAVVEFKKDLDRDKLYQSRGQAETYAALLKKPCVIVVGRAPSNPVDELQSRRIAEDFKLSGCHVLFADSDGYWLEDLKILLMVSSDRVFRQPAFSPNTGEFVGRLTAIENSVLAMRQSFSSSHQALTDAVCRSHQDLGKWFESSVHVLAKAIGNNQPNPYTSFLMEASEPKNVVVTKKQIPVWQLIAIATTGWIAGVFGFSFVYMAFTQPPDCSAEQNQWEWEATNGEFQGLRQSSEKLVQCLEQ